MLIIIPAYMFHHAYAYHPVEGDAKTRKVAIILHKK